MSQTKNQILIIEDSKATALLLNDYLKGMGYSDIHICEDGRSGIDTFKDIHSKGSTPIVLLDYFLPDMDARSIMTQLLELDPNVRVILETATEKSDMGVTELIRRGIYQYLEKPIRLEKLREVIETLEKEKEFFAREDAQLTLLKQAEEELYQQIDFLLTSHKQISLAMIEQFTESYSDEVSSYLDELESKGKVVKLENKRDICCNECNSVKTIQIFYCPLCKASDFKAAKLIEHYNCGNVAEARKYENDICPKCKKEIKLVGTDYKVLENHYVCNSCSDVFPDIGSHYLCLKCENKFKLEEARWKTSPYYKAVKMVSASKN